MQVCDKIKLKIQHHLMDSSIFVKIGNKKNRFVLGNRKRLVAGEVC